MTDTTAAAPSRVYPKAPFHYAVGRRKSAVARVRLYQGEGRIFVNGKTSREYFGGRDIHQANILEPLRLVGLPERFDIYVTVIGGGVSGQAGAVRHAIARALTRFDGELRSPLKTAKMLTRDQRAKERKKVGLKRARKAPQYTKR